MAAVEWFLPQRSVGRRSLGPRLVLAAGAVRISAAARDRYVGGAVEVGCDGESVLVRRVEVGAAQGFAVSPRATSIGGRALADGLRRVLGASEGLVLVLDGERDSEGVDRYRPEGASGVRRARARRRSRAGQDVESRASGDVGEGSGGEGSA